MIIFNRRFSALIGHALRAVILWTGLILILSIPTGAGALAADYKDLPDGLYAKIETSQGIILAELYFKKVPMTVINFVGLAQGTKESNQVPGKKFYDGLTFHRVVSDFMIQGGDPQGTGRGGPGYQFGDEFHPHLTHSGSGVLSMANSGPGTNGSQFFITHKATPHLDYKHSVFGRVVKGQDVVDFIEQGDVMKTITIIRKGDEAKAFKADQASFDRIQTQRVNAQASVAKEALASFQKEMSSKYPDAVKTDSGLMYVSLKPGSGPSVKKGATVSIHFTGVLPNGQKFISSRNQGDPMEFVVGVGGVMPGWDIGILGMKKGEMRRLLVPYPLAFGEAGSPGLVPPKTSLIFDMELIGFK